MRISKGYNPITCSFRHALLQEAIYDTILYEDRQLLHQKIAKVLKNTADEFFSNPNAIIGYHLEQSGSTEAVKYLIQAATQAANHFANDEAISFYQRIQKLIVDKDFQPTTSIDVALGVADVLIRIGESELAVIQLTSALKNLEGSPIPIYRRGDILYQLGHAYYEQGMLQMALENFKTASQLIESIPKECQLFSRTDTEREIGWIFWQQGKLGKALAHAKEALALAKNEANWDAEGSAYKLLSSIHYYHGQTKKSINYAKKSLRIREQVGDIWKATSTQTTLGYLYHQIGQWSLAEQILRQAIYVQKEISDHYLLADSLGNLGLLLLDKGNFDEALSCMNEALGIITGQNLPISMASLFYANRGTALLRKGDIDLAYQDFERALIGAKKQSNDEQCALAYAYLAETKIKMQDLPAAQNLMNKADVLISVIESNEFLREVFRIKSYLQRKLGNFDGALKSNREAQSIALEESNRYESARLSIDRAKILLASTNTQAICNSNLRTEVENALKIFQELGAHTGISWAEEILYQIAALHTESNSKHKKPSDFPTSIIDIRVDIPIINDTVVEPDEKSLTIQNMVAAELNNIVNKPNAFLAITPSGFAIVLTTINQFGMEDRNATEAVQYAISSIAAAVRIDNIIQNKFGHDLKIRVGVSIGTSKELIGGQEHAAMFASISQLGKNANQLSENAPNFQILLSGKIPRSIHEAYVLHQFNGLENRISQPCFLLGEAKSQHSLKHSIPKSTNNLIGRHEEYKVVKNTISKIIKKPKGYVIFIEAEAGMGKSRLLKEIKQIAESDIQFLHGKCEAFRRSISFWPLIEIINQMSAHHSSERDRLKSLLGLGQPDANNILLLQNLPAEALRKEIFSRASEFLKAQANQGPVILVIEDIHDIDLSTLDLVDYLLPIIFEAPISIMLIARSEMPGPHRSLVKKAKRVCQDRYLQIELTKLSKKESFQLVKELLGTNTIDPQLFTFLEPFIGHPLSVEEVVRFTIESGLLWKTKNGWKMDANAAERDSGMPANFRDLLLKRLELLDHNALHVLQAGALLGENFNQLILERMIPDSSLAQRLSELTEKRWLQKSSDGNPLHFMFNHTLTRETIYSTLVRSKKQLLHQRAGEAIESLYPESLEENLELLAYHFENSSLEDKALHYLVRAAEKSAHSFALDESRGYFTKARSIIIKRKLHQSKMMIRVTLGLADVYISLGETSHTLEIIETLLESNGNISPVFNAACLRRFGAALHLRGELSTALEKYNQALNILNAGQESQHQLGGNLAVSVHDEQIDIHIGLAKVYFDLGELQKSNDIAQNILDEMSRDHNYEKIAEIYNVLAGIAFRSAKFDVAQQLTEKGLACYQANNNRSKASSAYSNLGVLASIQQNFVSGHDNFEMALGIQTALGDMNGIAISTNNLGQLELNRGNTTQAKKYLSKSVETARRSELLRSLAQGLSNLGFTHIILGEFNTALNHLNEAKTLCNSHQYLDLLSENYWKLAECHLATGDLTKAECAADSALELAIEINNPDLEIHGMRIISRVLRKMGEVENALQMITKAWLRVQYDRDRVKVTRFANEYALCLIENDQTGTAADIVNDHIVNQNILEPEYIRKELIRYFPYLELLQTRE